LTSDRKYKCTDFLDKPHKIANKRRVVILEIANLNTRKQSKNKSWLRIARVKAPIILVDVCR